MRRLIYEQIDQLRHEIKVTNIENDELVDIIGCLDSLKDDITELLIANHKNNPDLDIRWGEYCLILEYIRVDDSDGARAEKERLDLLLDKCQRDKIKYNSRIDSKDYYLDSLISKYKKAVDVISYDNEDTEYFNYKDALLAKECCEIICKIRNTEENRVFYNKTMKKLAEYYIQSIEYIKSYKAGYENEDYLDWYEQVLVIDPTNSTALKALLQLKAKEDD